MSSHHDTTLSALGSTTPTGTDLNDKGIGSGTDTNTNTNTNPNPTTQNTTADQQTTHGHSNMGGPSHGSSTGAAGAAPGLSSSTQYDPHSTGYNPSTGSGYQTGSHAESKKTPGEGLGAGMGKTGESVGQGARDIYKGIHVRLFYLPLFVYSV